MNSDGEKKERESEAERRGKNEEHLHVRQPVFNTPFIWLL